jgi:hypothetical protein
MGSGDGLGENWPERKSKTKPFSKKLQMKSVFLTQSTRLSDAILRQY